jgi:hypothetical protein
MVKLPSTFDCHGAFERQYRVWDRQRVGRYKRPGEQEVATFTQTRTTLGSGKRRLLRLRH